ncbi:hypothetical protein CSV63_15845 [Sporosarcina sp. P34]|uniref:ATP-dependent nuclease n=1 Tax=Sporosarcina sp. P34 TaxID=2048247 RepID=UPI000C1633FC|nr:AAA family ATPase [Sporosarcina sp. P34]PID13845.1 hypothetical protein CSV63_15845 [Sporosarcina sp. P34]
MRFKHISIKNFRNFSEVNIEVDNKNIVFGRNDFGKTNFLYALRYMFDSKIRRFDFAESDYFRHNVDEPIVITVSIELGDDEDSNFLRSEMREATSFSEEIDGKQIVYIQLCGEYSIEERTGNPILSWGGHLDEMHPIQQKGNFTSIDKIFETVYIDPNVDPSDIYRKSRSILYQGTESNNHDDIISAISLLNEKISLNSRVLEIGEKLTTNYRGIRDEEIQIELKSEIEINGTFNHLVPYIKQIVEDGASDPNKGQLDRLYPTSGDGRRKLLAYALIRYLHELENEKGKGKKIYLYLIEEVENSLHPSMQQAISRHLFIEGMYNYIFTTTHSVDMLTYMDDVELIRIFKEDNLVQGHSLFYNVPSDYGTSRKKFNRLLSQALFSDRVLLVEGPSEEILFEATLEKLAEAGTIKYTDLERVSILDVGGIGFKEYIDILRELGIKTVVKTDNDLQSTRRENKYHSTGINRCLNLLPSAVISVLDTQYQRKNNKKDALQLEPVIRIGKQKKETMMGNLFLNHSNVIRIFKENNIFLSKIELEDDLIEVLKKVQGCHLNDVFYEKFGMKPIELKNHLKESKKFNMNSFVNSTAFNQEVVNVIYAHNLFICLQILVQGGNAN